MFGNIKLSSFLFFDKKRGVTRLDSYIVSSQSCIKFLNISKKRQLSCFFFFSL